MVWSFDATLASHDDLRAGVTERYRSRVVVEADCYIEAFLVAYAMAAGTGQRGEVTGLYLRI